MSGQSESSGEQMPHTQGVIQPWFILCGGQHKPTPFNDNTDFNSTLNMSTSLLKEEIFRSTP